jgi:hypothetical protein
LASGQQAAEQCRLTQQLFSRKVEGIVRMAPGGFVGDNEFQRSVRCGRMRIRQTDHAGNVEEFLNGRASIPTLRMV